MLDLKKRYVTDELNRPVAVQLDIATFERLEQIIEDYGLARLMGEDDDELLELEEARAYNQTLPEAP